MSKLEELNQDSETVKKIYEYHKSKEAQKPPRQGRLGASIIGRPCERSLWYSFRKLCPVEFDGRMLRLFETGHLEESRFIKELRSIGCMVHTIDPETDEQFQYTGIGGHFVCYPDGFALGLPEAEKTWHVLEFKTFGGTEDQKSKDFEKVKKNGVKSVKPDHYSQMMIGMGLAGLERALYLAKKKATDELYSERIKFDQDEFDRLMKRAERVISSANPPERCTDRPDDFRCRFCDAASICWPNTMMSAVRIPSKTCRSCCHATAMLGRNDASWTCETGEMMEPCDKHLLLPGLVSFADPTDSGDDWIEFTNRENGNVWKHGSGKGMWTTEELMRTAACDIGDPCVDKVKEVFNGTVIDNDLTLIDKYPPSDSELLWEGEPNNDGFIGAGLAIKKALGMKPSDFLSPPTDEFMSDKYDSREFGGKVLYVDYRGENYCAVWKGKE